MQSFIDLLKDHAMILESSRSLHQITGRAQPAPAAAFDALRSLACLVDAHLHAEEDFLARNAAESHGAFGALAEEHGQRFEDLVGEWGVYLREWTEENIAADWSTFAQATDWIMARLNEQVEAENRSLYPAALRFGLIRLLPEAGATAQLAS